MIPKLVHHVWPGDDSFSEKCHAFRVSWVTHHPDWTFVFWRRDSPLEHIEHEEVARVVDDPRYSVVLKSDILRLYVLERHGGLYVDTDFECLKPFDDLLDSTTGFFCGAESEKYQCPSLMASVPHHPFIRALLDAALVRLSQHSVEECNRWPNTITGPELLTRMAHGRQDVTVYPSSFFYPIHHTEMHRLKEPTPWAYAKHYWHGKGPGGWSEG